MELKDNGSHFLKDIVCTIIKSGGDFELGKGRVSADRQR
jgi:hypothetical protein